MHQVTEQDDEYPMFTTQNTRTKPWVFTVEIEGQPLEMEVDTGASLSLVSVATSVIAMASLCRTSPQFLPRWMLCLVKVRMPWTWNRSTDQAYLAAKQLLVLSHVLVHNDPKLELPACAASTYGVGAVLLHKIPELLHWIRGDGQVTCGHNINIQKRLNTSAETESISEGSLFSQGLFIEDDIAMQETQNQFLLSLLSCSHCLLIITLVHYKHVITKECPHICGLPLHTSPTLPDKTTQPHHNEFIWSLIL